MFLKLLFNKYIFYPYTKIVTRLVVSRFWYVNEKVCKWTVNN